MEDIGDQYRAAYLAHDVRIAPFADHVRFTENSVEMNFPDASWDTVTAEIGPALTLSDPSTGSVGIYTAIMQNDTPGFLAIRLRIEDGRITEAEHIVSTRRNLSSPPTPIGDVNEFKHDPDLNRPVPAGERANRQRLVELANGYFDTLQQNDGQLHTKFSDDATRFENGMKFAEIANGFRSGRYRFNERVRDRDYFLVDEERGIVMARGFIDHKGVLDKFKLTDGTEVRSIFREPQTWHFLEMFKIKNDMITGVEATFIAVPYYMPSPWTQK
ncbi:MAG: hypothetical protein H6978_12665 [Gammaproteobacteria bacterium]|nr:hypothetical protein [Gammaproteobacteria bacterium]